MGCHELSFLFSEFRIQLFSSIFCDLGVHQKTYTTVILFLIFSPV